LKVRCPEECGWKGEVLGYSRHIEICPQTIVTCPIEVIPNKLSRKIAVFIRDVWNMNVKLIFTFFNLVVFLVLKK